MATTTTNYKLKKPETNDFYNIEDFNQNMDLIDEQMHKSDELIKKYFTLTENSNMDDITEPGKYYCPTNAIAKTITNMPFTDLSSTTIVEKVGTSGIIIQICYGNDGSAFFMRRKYAGKWYEWNKYITQKDLEDDKNCISIPENSDLNDYKTPGRYYVKSINVAATIANLEIKDYISIVYVEKLSNIITQINVSSNGSGFCIRRFYNNAWSEWESYVTLSELMEERQSINNAISSIDNWYNYGMKEGCVAINSLLIQWGVVEIKPTTINTPTKKTVNFSKPFLQSPLVLVTPSTTVPGKQVTGVGTFNTKTTSVDIYLTRSVLANDPSSVQWLAIGHTPGIVA